MPAFHSTQKMELHLWDTNYFLDNTVARWSHYIQNSNLTFPRGTFPLSTLCVIILIPTFFIHSNYYNALKMAVLIIN